MIVPSIAPAISAWIAAKRMREYNDEMDRHESWLVDHGYETYSSYDFELDEKLHSDDVAKRGFWNRILCDIGFAIGISYFKDALSEKSNSGKFLYLVLATVYSFSMILGMTLFFGLFGFGIVMLFQCGVAGCCVGTIMALLLFVLPGMCWIAYRWEYIKRK